MKNYVIIIFLNAFDHGLKGVCGGWTGSRVEGVGEGMFVFLGGGWVVYEAYEGKKKRENFRWLLLGKRILFLFMKSLHGNFFKNGNTLLTY